DRRIDAVARAQCESKLYSRERLVRGLRQAHHDQYSHSRSARHRSRRGAAELCFRRRLSQRRPDVRLLRAFRGRGKHPGFRGTARSRAGVCDVRVQRGRILRSGRPPPRRTRPGLRFALSPVHLYLAAWIPPKRGNSMIDLRSDTLTRPTEAMLESMREATLGDDSRDGDATVQKLEAMAAERMGKETGAYMPSGTMTNLVAMLTHGGRGGEVLLEDG